jgi:hypothetical protein
VQIVEGAGFPFQVKSPEDGVDDVIQNVIGELKDGHRVHTDYTLPGNLGGRSPVMSARRRE